MSQDTGKFREGLKDQFYTNNTIAQNCITIIKNNCVFYYFILRQSRPNGHLLG